MIFLHNYIYPEYTEKELDDYKIGEFMLDKYETGILFEFCGPILFNPNTFSKVCATIEKIINYFTDYFYDYVQF